MIDRLIMRSSYIHIAILFLVILTIRGYSQTGGILINGAASNVIMQSGAHLILTQSWQNSGVSTLDNNSTVHFASSSNSYISGTTTTTFGNVEVNCVTGLMLVSSCNVNSVFTMTSGLVDLYTSVLNLGTSGSISGEAATRRFLATNTLTWAPEGSGTGTITATRISPAGNVAGMGLTLPVNAMGNTVITRGQRALAGSGTFAGNSSILRYYNILPTAKQNLAGTIFTYWDAELNGHVEANLQMYEEVQYLWGAATGPLYWEPRATVLNTVANTANATVIYTVPANQRITLGSTTTPLPIELFYFEGSCENGQVELVWESAQELTSVSFIVEYSLDGSNWVYLDEVQAGYMPGNTYSYTVPLTGPTIFRIQTRDQNEETQIFGPISVTCNQINEWDIIPVNPSQSIPGVFVKGVQGESFQLSVVNLLGQQLSNYFLTLGSGQEFILLNNIELAAGSYYISLTTEKSRITKPVLVQ